MERIETKKINGKIYYYYSTWGWVNGKCRRTFQKYLGKPEDIYRAIHETQNPEYAEIFEFGLPIALWKEIKVTKIIEIVDDLCPKRTQGLSIGNYLSIAAINRAIDPTSKKGMWDWFKQTSLHRLISGVNAKSMASQRFWDHMDAISAEYGQKIWSTIIKNVLHRESIGLSDICYDGTNFYSFISTFNTSCSLAQRGKNKQGRSNLRQVNYALFCTAKEQIPLSFDIYPGNRNDCPEFSEMIEQFKNFLINNGLPVLKESSQAVTLIFDKGNNSKGNIELLDNDTIQFIGSVKLHEHEELASISNDDSRFEVCKSEELEGIKAFSIEKKIYGKERKVIICYNPHLFEAQWMTINNDITKAIQRLASLRQRLSDREKGLIKGGKAPTHESVTRQVNDIVKRPFIKDIINCTISKDSPPRLEYSISNDTITTISDTYLGKKLIITTRTDWDNERILKAYHSQYAIEHVFRNMKDRKFGVWWPMNHWTNQKIQIHGLYCTIAVLIRSLIYRRIRKNNIKISFKRMLEELKEIREVVNIYKAKKNKQRTGTVLTKNNEIQQKLMNILKIPKKPQEVNGI